MSWRTITEADIKTRISGSELETLRAAHLGDDQTDPIPGIISQITNKVRRACVSAGNIAMGAEGTIPEDLLSEALDLIVREIMKRPGYIGEDALTKVRLESAKTAEDMLASVAAGKDTIAGASADGSADAGEYIGESAKTFSASGELMS